MIAAWRIVKRKHLKSAFTGDGARLYGGRWNSPGRAVVYTAQSVSLAALELLVHLETADILRHYVVVELRWPREFMESVARAGLPGNWAGYPPPLQLRELGDNWAAERRTAVLEVPSAVVPTERIYLLNPAHREFAQIRIGEPVPSRFDRRLRR
ncbi:MAG: RES domain-containing protein [Bryobacteraceae bacterium]